jgi:hypothetical protein
MTTLLPQVQRKSTEGRLGRLKNTMGIRTGDYTPDDRSNRRGPANGHDEYDVSVAGTCICGTPELMLLSIFVPCIEKNKCFFCWNLYMWSS